MTGNEAREIFIEYFKKHHHQHVRSSSLVPQDDPTLLFVNSGMVQFKRVFTGDEKRAYDRAVTSQKCVRAGGKHNDLENVGYTARHHTFFEMLGNFSFGEYFKEKAIAHGWDLLTNGYGFDGDKLWVSVYLDDDEAYNIWRDQIGVPEEKIVRLGEEENFWAMGDTGPCGPCSEIHIDRGVEYGCGREDCTVGCDCDRFLELWNLVFMQFERDGQGNMTPLPKPSIDTGLGLERMAAVLQNVKTNFETDLFVPIMEKVETLSGYRIYESRQTEVAMKVIADHSRATAFLICDGVLPSNEGRGYVLRRIMRRAVRYGRNIGLTEAFLHHTVEKVFDIMEGAYPELRTSAPFILNVVRNEEEKFLETLGTGMKLLEDAVAGLEADNEKVIPGDLIFKLYDTYGFPVDIVQDVIKDSDMVLDTEGFEKAMAAQRLRSKSKTRFDGLAAAYRPLVNQGVKTVFTGYDSLTETARVLMIVKDGTEIESARKGDAVEIVFDRTPFYAESGGQVGDTGRLDGEEGEAVISATFSDPSGLIIHRCRIEQGTLHNSETVKLTVDKRKRDNTAKNHTATHILHSVLRRVIGDHVKQAGSLVSDERLRFDFTGFSPISENEISEIEREVNRCIRENHPVETEEMTMDEAVDSGAIALFEEKYGEKVRVVSQADYSRELCGGTHTDRTGDIGVFKILSEAGISAGVRRIEAVTGEAAVEKMIEEREILNAVSGRLKGVREEIVQKVDTILKDRKELEKSVASLKARIVSKSAEHIDEDLQVVNGVNVVAKEVSVDSPSQLRDLADKFKNRIGSGIVLLGARSNGKALLISVVTEDLTGRYKAGDIVKEAAAIVGGGGGGRPDMAQAGGPDPDKLDEALHSVFQTIS